MYKNSNYNNIHLDFSIQQDGRLRLAQLKMLEMLIVVDAICQKHGLVYWLDRGTLLGAIRHQGFIPWDDDVDISMPRESFNEFLRVAPHEMPPNLTIQTAETDIGYFNLAAPLKIRDTTSRFIEKHEQGDEPYQQGIFIDVFAYDNMPANRGAFHCKKWLAKKIQRLLKSKYTPMAMGHHAAFYSGLSRVVAKSTLRQALQRMIDKANANPSHYIGYGFDSIKKIQLARESIYPLQRVLFEGVSLAVPHKTQVVLTALYGDYLTPPPESQRRLNHCKHLEL